MTRSHGGRPGCTCQGARRRAEWPHGASPARKRPQSPTGKITEIRSAPPAVHFPCEEPRRFFSTPFPRLPVAVPLPLVPFMSGCSLTSEEATPVGLRWNHARRVVRGEEPAGEAIGPCPGALMHSIVRPTLRGAPHQPQLPSKSGGSTATAPRDSEPLRPSTGASDTETNRRFPRPAPLGHWRALGTRSPIQGEGGRSGFRSTARLPDGYQTDIPSAARSGN